MKAKTSTEQSLAVGLLTLLHYTNTLHVKRNMNTISSFFAGALVLVTVLSYGQTNYVDPTGSYTLKGKRLKNGERANHGEVHVKLIDNSRLAISFYYNKGYPSYNSGSFVDTLDYVDHKAVYTFYEPERPGSDCKLIFTFHRNKLNIKHEAEDYNYSCGFGMGVVVSGTMPKTSTRVPEIKDFWENED